MELLKERLAYYRTQFHNQKCSYEKDREMLNGILDDEYISILNNLSHQKSAHIHQKLLTKHQQKFQDIIKYNNVSFANAYIQLLNFSLTLPTFAGPLKSTVPTLKSPDVVKNTVVNLSDVNIFSNEKILLSMGLKLIPPHLTTPRKKLTKIPLR